MKNGLSFIHLLIVALFLSGCGSGGTSSRPDPSPAPEIAVSPSALNFGDNEIDTSKYLEISVSNSGTATLGIIGLNLTAESSADFSITKTIDGASIEPGDTAVLELRYSPGNQGIDTGEVQIESNDTYEPTITIPLYGRGLDDTSGNNDHEGFGAVTQGAAGSPTGYDIYHVTSLSDSGTGTLRDALSRGNRRVVFDVGGTIVLQSDLNIPYSYITIDGSSAPSPGITIVQPGDIKTTIEAKSSIGAAHDIIIHHLRMDGQASGHTNDGDIWGLDGESAPVYNIILDHITAMASTDGIFDIWEDVHDVTISWNLITDTVTACHLSTGDTDKARRRISIHHNVFAHNNERQIRMRHNNQLIDFVNNVIYGWGWMESGASGLHIAYDSGETNPSANVVNNVYHYVSGLSGSQDSAIIFESGSSVGDVYFSGNLLPGGENDAVSTSGQLSIPSSAQVTLYAADTLRNSVVPYVGTHYPLPDEQQLLGDIQSALGN